MRRGGEISGQAGRQDDKALSKIRILLVTDKFSPEIGGACAVAEALAANLPANVTIVAPQFPAGIPEAKRQRTSASEWKSYDLRFGFPVHRVKTFNGELPEWLPRRLRGALQFGWNVAWIRPRAAMSLRRLLRQHPADVLCINTLSCYWVPGLLRRSFPELKTVFYLHGEEISSRQRRRLDDLAQARLRQANAVVTVSRFTRELATNCGVLADRITVIHNGVDLDKFTPGPPDEVLLQRWGVKGRKVLLCLARLDERKGQDRLLQAMPAILIAVPDTVLILAGAGADEGRLRTLAERLGLKNSVVFTGAVPASEVTPCYRSADVYAMPNRTTASGDTEGFGLVFLEAGACAKPVIGGLAGGVPDAVLPGETGLLVDGENPDAIAAAVIRLLRDQEEAKRMGENGLLHARRNSWPVQAQVFLDLCEGLLSSETRMV